MKNFKVVLFAVIAAGFSLTSCNKDDGNDDKASINGKWFYSQEGIGSNGQEVLVDYTDHEANCSKDFVEFLDNSVFKDTDFYNSSCDNDTETSQWSLNDNNLTIGTGGDQVVVEVVNLSNDELKIRSVSEAVNGQTVYDIVVFTRN